MHPYNTPSIHLVDIHTYMYGMEDPVTEMYCYFPR